MRSSKLRNVLGLVDLIENVLKADTESYSAETKDTSNKGEIMIPFVGFISLLYCVCRLMCRTIDFIDFMIQFVAVSFDKKDV